MKTKESTRQCVKCGTMFSGRACLACARAMSKAYREANKEKCLERSRKWRLANLEKSKVAIEDWRARNKEKVKQGCSEYYEKHRDYFRKYGADYYQKNKEKASVYGALRYEANREVHKAKSSAWVKENPAAAKLIQANRRSRKKNASGSLSKGLEDRLYALQKGKCACCRQPLGENYHLDHIMPLALGGTNTDDNIQLLRQRCNNQKHAKHPVDFMQSRGFLL